MWLLKSEPDVFSIDDLARVTREPWNGVRNYQARNFLRAMQINDMAWFYHSNCDQPAIVGLMKIVESAHPDPSQFDPASPYHDPASSLDKPRWDQVVVQFDRKIQPITLAYLKQQGWNDFPLVQKGSRLSVMPVPVWVHLALLHVVANY
jgi:predicted RNA-binding protein with PUA-like domain